MSSFVFWLAGVSGISAFGWLLIAVVYVPATVVVLVLVLGPWKHRRWLTAAMLAIVYLPLVAGIAEAVYVDRRFKALCATAVTQIKQRVTVEGFYDVEYRGDAWETYLRTGETGYRFVEWTERGSGRIWRSERVGPGEVRRLPLDKPSARYHWRNPEFSSPYGHLMKRREETIVDTLTGEVIASRVMGYRYLAFIDRVWGQFMDGGPQICKSSEILSKTLIGIDRKEN